MFGEKIIINADQVLSLWNLYSCCRMRGEAGIKLIKLPIPVLVIYINCDKRHKGKDVRPRKVIMGKTDPFWKEG